MTIKFHPKSLLVTGLFLLAFSVMLAAATGPRRGVMVGGLAVLAYLLIDVFAVVNPVVWWRERRGRR